MKTVLKAQAPAKLNLTLEVLGRRADGYHAIASIFHRLNLADEITVEIDHMPYAPIKALSLAIQSDGWNVPTDARNTVWQAIEQFFKRFPVVGAASVSVQIHKRIPTQAGLGGGSSDAGAVLKLLADWAQSIGISVEGWETIADSIGSDVRFFLNGACALVGGRGEQVFPLPTLPPFWWVLAKPYKVGVPTAWAYQQLRRPLLEAENIAGTRSAQLAQAIQQSAIQAPVDLVPYLHNDFESVVLSAFSQLTELCQAMQNAGVLTVMLCGSGAVQAGLCESEAQAKAIAEQLCRRGYWSEPAFLAND